MANKKFSEFTVKTSTSDVDFVVGYDGTDNVRITPANLTGGGGASSLNGLTDCLVDTESLYVGEVPSSLSGNPQNNTSLGIDASRDLTTATQTTSIGNRAGKQTTTGLGNTNLGYQAGSQNQTGIFNTNIGNGSGFWNTASYNVFVGYDSGQVTGGYNTGIGVSALGKAFSSSCIQSVAVGYRAGHQQTAANVVMIGFDSARANTATAHISIGSQAGYSNTSGEKNTNLGFRAAYNNTTGGDNVNVGYNAGYTATGSQNTAVGRSAFGGGFGHSGVGNVALGYLALQSPSGASNNNVAIGSEALKASGTKSNNVAVGYKAGFAATTGESNTLMGYEAGLAITTAGKNVLMGYQSGKSLVAGSNSGSNVFVGYQTGFGANNANYNTLLGYQTGYGLTDGENNTIIGSFASAYGGALTTGDNNTIIGNAAYPSAATVSNEITLGNSSISTLRCAVTSITSLSDERDKSEIKDLEYGLAFIDALQPREFVWNNRPETDGDGEEFYSANKGKKDFGFIAQEVKELDNDTLRLVYDENPEKLELSYGKLVPVLVQAIKELKAEIELLKS